MGYTPKAKRLFLVRASWRATAKTLRVEAYDEDDAIARATRAKENAGALDIVVLKEITSGNHTH